MRKIGLDIGTVRIGISQSDMLGIIATGSEVYKRINIDKDTDYIARLIKEKEADTVVIGKPFKMDGTEGQSVQMIKEFADNLAKKSSVNIAFQDERLSTVSAERILLEADVKRSKRKEVIDKIAATIILQNYLDKTKK